MSRADHGRVWVRLRRDRGPRAHPPAAFASELRQELAAGEVADGRGAFLAWVVGGTGLAWLSWLGLVHALRRGRRRGREAGSMRAVIELHDLARRMRAPLIRGALEEFRALETEAALRAKILQLRLREPEILRLRQVAAARASRRRKPSPLGQLATEAIAALGLEASTTDIVAWVARVGQQRHVLKADGAGRALHPQSGKPLSARLLADVLSRAKRRGRI